MRANNKQAKTSRLYKLFLSSSNRNLEKISSVITIKIFCDRSISVKQSACLRNSGAGATEYLKEPKKSGKLRPNCEKGNGMSEAKEIIKNIQQMTSGYSPYEVFSDWIKCCSIAISQSVTLFPKSEKEKEYESTLTKYNETDRKRFPNMLALLCLAFENEMRDVLGEIFMSQELGNSRAGQFFTPFHISQLTADMAIKQIEQDGKCLMYEPSCGSGGMIIAAAKRIKEKGYDYQRTMEVVAQDVDWRSVYMTYVQLSLLGINAVVCQGDSLSNEVISEENKLYTPRKAGVLI